MRGLVFGPKNPNVARRRHDASSQNVGEKSRATARLYMRIGTRLNCPTGSVPLLEQRHLVAGAVGSEVGAECPDIVWRIGCDAEETIRLEVIRGADVRAGNNVPTCSVKMLDERERSR